MKPKTAASESNESLLVGADSKMTQTDDDLFGSAQARMFSSTNAFRTGAQAQFAPAIYMIHRRL
jgi:hypothetical protein